MSENGKSREEKYQDDFVGKGFHRLDPKLVKTHPPKIAWGEAYREWSWEEKVVYLEKLSSTMNHAAHLIQVERNQLLELCVKKEKQIENMKTALDQNNEMIQQQVTKFNEQINASAAEVTRLNKRAKELMTAGCDCPDCMEPTLRGLS